MASVNYPTNFPFAELTLIVTALKSGTVSEKKAEVASAVWIVQGYGMAQAFGNPALISTQSIDAEPISEADQIAKLEELVAAADPDKLSPQLFGLPIDWITIIQIIVQIVAKLLESKSE